MIPRFIRRVLVLVLASISILAAAPTAEELIKGLKMQLIPGEGCWFAVTYKSNEPIAGPAAGHVAGAHMGYSAIYALETPKNFSAMHRLATDEMWHFYSGSPVEMLLLYPDGHGETVVIGPDVLAGQKPQFLVPRGVWQGSRPLGAYALFGTTLTPGFEYSDYTQGYRDELQKAYPAFGGRIAQLTRPEFGHRDGPPPSGPAAPPALELQEIVGRTAKEHSDKVSVAFFRLQPGAGSAMSYNHEGEEIFIIVTGHGGVIKGLERVPVGPGSVVNLEPSVHRSVRADAGEVVEFYAVTSPRLVSSRTMSTFSRRQQPQLDCAH